MPDKKSSYLSDNWTTEDHLDFHIFQPALMDIIQNADTPLTIGVYGSWGSGKTSLLRMLEKEIKEKGLPSFRPVWFTAWKYDKQEVLWKVFILRVIDGLYPKENGQRIEFGKLGESQREGVWFLEKLEESVYQNVSWQGETSWILDLAKTGKELVKLPIWLGLHLAKLGDSAKDLGITPNLADLIGREAKEHYLHQLSSMEMFESSFKEAITKILGDDGRLVIFVDDLDRCLPEKVVEILEAIKLFLNVEQTVFVLGMDREVIRRGIESHYGKHLQSQEEQNAELPIDGHIYLHKLIQLPFNLPPMILDRRKKFIEILKKHLDCESYLDDITCEVFARGLHPNPRQVKRVLNVFNLLRNISDAQMKDDLIPDGSISLPLLAKTVLIQSQWPEFYKEWCKIPTLIQTFERESAKYVLSLEERMIGRDDINRTGKPGVQEAESDIALMNPEESTLSEKITAKFPMVNDSDSYSVKKDGILYSFLTDHAKYSGLLDLIEYPKERDSKEGQETHFSGLSLSKLNIYLGLAGTADQERAESSQAVAAFEWNDLNRSFQSGHVENVDAEIAKLRDRLGDIKNGEKNRIINNLLEAAQNPEYTPVIRARAANVLDELEYDRDDLDELILIKDEGKPDFYIGKYPVTNLQYQRFLEADDFSNKEYWIKFPYFREPEENIGIKFQLHDTGEKGWQWLQNEIKEKNIENGKIFPRYWDDSRFGINHKYAPVVGINWYEANAYCKWLLANWEKNSGTNNESFIPKIIRLPTEDEWITAAGGDRPENRFPWDVEEVTDDTKEIIKRANVAGSNIGQTTPVFMYPQGKSTKGVMDMAGNVWEWQANYYDIDINVFAIRGGSWYPPHFARMSERHPSPPNSGWFDRGFRLAAFPRNSS